MDLLKSITAFTLTHSFTLGASNFTQKISPKINEAAFWCVDPITGF